MPVDLGTGSFVVDDGVAYAAVCERARSAVFGEEPNEGAHNPRKNTEGSTHWHTAE